MKVTAITKFPELTYFFTPKLRSVDIEPTNHCNLKCVTCYSYKRQKGFMSMCLFKKAVDMLDGSFENLSLGLNFGGESLLHPDFPKMLGYVHGKSCFREVGFNTNGMLLTKELMTGIVENVDWIKFSLEGIGMVNDRIRIGCDYRKVVQNIKDLIEIRGTKKKSNISINVTESTQTKQEIRDFIEYWTRIVDAVYVSVYINENLKASTAFFEDKSVVAQRFCQYPFGYMGILWNGDVVACCSDWNGVNIMGSILTNSLKEIWGGRQFKTLRYESLKNSFPSQLLCNTCDWWKTSFKPTSTADSDLNIKFYSHTKEYSRINGRR